MSKKKLSRTLPPQPRKRRPKHVMAPPNDDIDAYGWELRQIRLPSADDKREAGRPAFYIKTDIASIKKYGTEVTFACPQYVQMLFDADPAIERAVQKAKAADWTPAALEKLKDAILGTFNEKVLVSIAENFYRIAPMIADFYAARQAYIDLHGKEQEDEDQEPETDQIEASTTKSRR